MKTIEERAKELATVLCIDGSDPELSNLYKYDIACIIEALKEQDKLTRHAIAEALCQEAGSIKIGGERIFDVIEVKRAETIAMNTCAM